METQLLDDKATASSSLRNDKLGPKKILVDKTKSGTGLEKNKNGIKKNQPCASAEEHKNKKLQPLETDRDNKKYNFYRKPSIKKKVPEVKHTLTSYKRMLKANPLLEYEMEGKDLSLLNKLANSAVSQTKYSQSNSDARKPHPTNLKRTTSLKVPNKNCVTQPPKSIILSRNKPNLNKSVTSLNTSSKTEDFNPSTSKLLSSTKLEGNTPDVIEKIIAQKRQSSFKDSQSSSKTIQDKAICSSGAGANSSMLNSWKGRPIRRSLSAQHFDRKKGVMKPNLEKCFSQVKVTQSLEDMSSPRPSTLHQISTIAESSHENSIVFKTPSAYERRSIAWFTPKSAPRRSLYIPTTPLPSLSDLQKRLNDWLIKRGKNVSCFNNLKSFITPTKKSESVIDEENKENIEVDQDLSKGSYEELIITLPISDGSDKKIISEEHLESVAKAALVDLHKLIQEGYPRAQCEGWLELIRSKYKKLEEESQYWECRAALEQSRCNFSNAVECYKTAIIQGAEINSVDESLDVLLKKFSLLNISTDQIEDDEKSIKDRTKIITDARKVFKSSIIQFAIQEKKLKKNLKVEDERKTLLVTPVRRSTRLSRSAYTSTPGIKLCSSLRELDSPDRSIVDFKMNAALL